MAYRPAIGRIPDFRQPCTLCNGKESAPYRLSHEYIKELGGNPQRDAIHLTCLEKRQLQLQRFPFQRVTLDTMHDEVVDTYVSDHEKVFEDTPVGRELAKDRTNIGLTFHWQDRAFFIEPQRSVWIAEHTTYPRNILISVDANKWWLYLPRNQALMYKMTWGGDVQDA